MKLDGQHWLIWRKRIGLCLLAAFVLKMILALTTFGSTDANTWGWFWLSVRARGIGVYHQYATFNHPPFILHLLSLEGWTAGLTGLAFPFWLRLPGILADVGSTVLIWHFAATRHQLRFDPRAIALFACAPVSIMIAGFHGNTDPTMIFFVLLAVVLGQQKRPAWQVGLAFGMAMNFKIVPVVLLPIFLLSLPGWRQRFAFGMAAITAIVVASLPYILIEPGFIVRRLFSYGSIYGQWGIPSLLGALPPQLAWLNAMYNIVGKYVMLVAVGSVPLWLRYLARERPSLFEQCAAAFLIFMVLTPGFGVQYLVWVVPWMIVAGFLPALLFFAASGAFLFAYYTFFAGGIPWYTAFAVPEYPLPSYIMAVGIVCWLTIVIALVCMLRSLRAQYSIRRQLAIVLASA